MGDGDFDPSGLVELVETLTASRCLRTLSLERNYIGKESCVALGKLLETRNPLSHLKYERILILLMLPLLYFDTSHLLYILYVLAFIRDN